MIHIGLLDENFTSINVLKLFLNKHKDFTVTASTNNSNTLLSLLQDDYKLIDTIILDLKTIENEGLRILKELQKNQSQVHVIVLADFFESAYFDLLLKLGVDAFLPKNTPLDKLSIIINEVKEKAHYFDNKQTKMLVGRSSFWPNSSHPSSIQEDVLAPIEIEVLSLINQQFTIEEIAERLFISVSNTQMHKDNLLLKTNTRNTSELIRYASENKQRIQA